MSSVRVCVVGSGGREHALARTLAREADVVVTPGNPGMPDDSGLPGRITTSAMGAEAIEADLVVIGPEAPLVDGLADRLRAAGRLVVGPGADGAQLEGSKAFMKEVLDEAGVATARFGVFEDPAEASVFLRSLPGPYVVKTDGLAAGKGVLVAQSLEEAEADIAAKLSGTAFGDVGRRVVVEEGLDGTECSLLALCDGRRVVPLAPAQDFKRIGNGDAGANTGGMGAYSPLIEMDDALISRVVDEAIEPVVVTLRKRGIDYRGVLYAGIMLTAEGPKVLEYNVRFGDPEAQVVLPRLVDSLVDLLMGVASGSLADTPRNGSDASVCVVLAAPGYPGTPEKGAAIGGLDPAGQLSNRIEGVCVLHAGTERPDPDGPFVTAGGRVLWVTALAPTLALARQQVYAGVAQIHFEGMQYRRDIADHAAQRSGASR